MAGKIYVGIRTTSQREVFKSVDEPIGATHGHIYDAVIGPFRTMRGAYYMADWGANNPHILCVADAERLSRA